MSSANSTKIEPVDGVSSMYAVRPKFVYHEGLGQWVLSGTQRKSPSHMDLSFLTTVSTNVHMPAMAAGLYGRFGWKMQTVSLSG